MATILLIIIYISFISLGIPDSIFGTAWPAIYEEFNLPISYANIIITLSCISTTISSLLSSKVINRFGTNKVTAVSTLLTAISMLLYAYSPNFPIYCLLTIPLGLGAGAIDTGLNNYVATHYKASHMNFLHCFYGIGVSLSPYLMSISLSSENNWRSGYKMAFIIQFIIAIITIIAIPLWNKKSSSHTKNAPKTKTLSFKEIAKISSVRIIWLVFIGACAVECTSGIWASTYFVEHIKVSHDIAAKITMLFYAGLAVGRFLSGLFSVKFTSWQIIFASIVILFLGILTMIISPIITISCMGLFAIGLSIGPVFPNLVHLTPKNFGEEISQSVMGTQMAASYFGIIFIPSIFGFLAQLFGTWLFPIYIMIMYGLMTIPMYYLVKHLKKDGRF